MIPAEGNCETSKYQELNRDFHSYFYLLDPSDRFDIQIASSSIPQNKVLEACNYVELSKAGHRESMLPVVIILRKSLGWQC